MKSVNTSNTYSRELVLDVPQGTAVILSKKVQDMDLYILLGVKLKCHRLERHYHRLTRSNFLSPSKTFSQCSQILLFAVEEVLHVTFGCIINLLNVTLFTWFLFQTFSIDIKRSFSRPGACLLYNLPESSLFLSCRSHTNVLNFGEWRHLAFCSTKDRRPRLILGNLRRRVPASYWTWVTRIQCHWWEVANLCNWSLVSSVHRERLTKPGLLPRWIFTKTILS